MTEQHTVGPEKVSMTVIRKTEGDLVVSQASFERWFEDVEEADAALTRVLRVFTDGGNREIEHVVRLQTLADRLKGDGNG